MTIIEIRIDELKEYENNPRINDDSVNIVKKSIEEFGFKVPIVVDKNNVIVTGHTRLKAAKKLGYEKVPCIIADDLTEEQIKAFRLVDNKTNEFSKWDFNKLDVELHELADSLIDMSEFDFDSLKDLGDELFSEEFTLPDGDRPEIEQMSFTLHREQAELIRYALEQIDVDEVETFGNTNKNGNRLYGVISQWAEQKM